MRLQASLLRRMEVAVCSLAAAISFGPSIASASAPPAALYYLQGHDVRRISLADLRETTVLTLPTAVDPADVRALPMAGGSPSLCADGQRSRALRPGL